MNSFVKNDEFRDLLRIFNTNVDGKICLGIALT